MSAPLNCCQSCGTVIPQQVPGVAGQDAFTTVGVGGFTTPALGAQVTIPLLNTSWMAVGNTYFVPGSGWYTLDTILSLTSATFTYLNIAANTNAGAVIAAGVKMVSASVATDGTDGVNSFTTITAGSPNTPILGGTLTDAPVGNSTWMTVGQNIFVQGSGYYTVTAKSDATHFTGTYLNISANTNAGNAIAANSGVSPAGSQIGTPVSVAEGGTASATATLARAALGVGGASLTVYAAGTAYSLTNTAAALDFGTTDPALVITSAGTWLLLARVRVDYTAATFAAVRTGTLKLRRTNNTAADLGNGSASFLTEIITTLTYTLDVLSLPPVIYVTTNANDAITIFGDISVVPTAGSLDCVQAEIVAIKLFDQTI